MWNIRSVKESPIDQARSSFIDGAIALLCATIGAYMLYKLMKRVMVCYAYMVSTYGYYFFSNPRSFDGKHGREAPAELISQSLDMRSVITEYTTRLWRTGVCNFLTCDCLQLTSIRLLSLELTPSLRPFKRISRLYGYTGFLGKSGRS